MASGILWQARGQSCSQNHRAACASWSATANVFFPVEPRFNSQALTRRAVALDSLQWETMKEDRVIGVDPDVMNGIPCFRGTRVPFKNMIDYLEGGHSLGEFLRQFPAVTHEMATRALEEAKDSLLARIA